MSKINAIWREYIWEEITENRVNYYVEYHPVNLKSLKFAQLDLVYTLDVKTDEIVKNMEYELNLWLKRFPLPLLVMAFDKSGDKISLSNVKPNSELIGYIDTKPNRIIKSWNKISDNELPIEQTKDENISKVYQGLAYIKREQKEREANHKIDEAKKIKKFIDISLFSWIAFSIIIAYLGWQNYYVGAIAFVYTLYKSLERFWKIKEGRDRKSIEKDNKNMKMRHYYYHCELNPKGFERLKAENFKKEEEERIRAKKEKISQS
ncbi:hypothetical protein AWH56_021825 [Anaerobacillus isosaccharinicus]|uniref:Uncharacterized protein n=1 Tax=Anaerobacillus isosaccharinicus TaxID=1532552 RepID=A0A1S2MET9_9BACI|nr:hypothetical protein [Anaerobacillus isosaccharinicus]MBA5586457.1 hypothetical protein [Anaerobacillus isosaccharinicus]QOY35300.1 hypothetical protein AWH56_021825 [Anaerobacillus isosaccharinicus]